MLSGIWRQENDFLALELDLKSARDLESDILKMEEKLNCHVDKTEIENLIKEFPACESEIHYFCEDKCKWYHKHPPSWKTKTILINKIKRGITIYNDNPQEKKLKEKKKEEKVPGKIEIIAEIKEKLESPELIQLTKKELDKTHLLDDNAKMTGFIVAMSGLSNNPRKRMSQANTGESSVGKDNLVLSILQHFPKESWMFLTGATQPALEDTAIYTPILALSEMNLFSEFGANKALLEVVKQRTEGGTAAIKKDADTGFSQTKKEITEQGTTFYNTTEAERNNQSETRFIFVNIEANEKKVRLVNTNTCDSYSDIIRLLENSTKKESWICQGIRYLLQEFGECEILIPYANVLLKEIKGSSIIDNTNPRSMRDLKRLLALVSACTFYHALQRKVVAVGDKKVLISEPIDLLNVLSYSQEFFNQTYTGLDERLSQVLQLIDSSVGGWIARDFLQRSLKVSVNTIKSYCDSLEESGLVEWKKGSDLNFQENVKTYDGNKIYYKRYQKGIKKMLIRCQENELKELLDKEYGKEFYENIDTFLYKRYQNKGINLEKEGIDTFKKLENPEIDTFSLTPLDFTQSGAKEAREDE